MFGFLTSTDGTACRLNEFRCRHGNKCIDESKKCDHWDDCGDNSDEEGCGELVGNRAGFLFRSMKSSAQVEIFIAMEMCAQCRLYYKKWKS